MYVIDLTTSRLQGCDCARTGAGRKMADFLTALVAHAFDFDRPDDAPAPVCFNCRKRDQRVVETGMTEHDVVVWRRLACRTEGQISNWQGTLWDLSHGTTSN